MASLKKLLPLTAAALLLMLASTAAPAAAAGIPCWQRVINDWFDGRIDNTYPIPCYQEAIQHLPEDVQTYSSAADQISRALLEAIRHDRELGEAADTRDTSNNHRSGAEPVAFGGGGGGGDGGHKGFVTKLFERFGPQNAESVPLPLLLLAGVSILLLAAAAASFVAKRIQARRLAPAPAPAPARANPGPKRP
jgi:hypothetical protein